MTRSNPGAPRRDSADPSRPDSPLNAGDASLYETPFGREDDHGTLPGSRAEAEIEDIDIDARPASEVTGEPDPSMPDETIDGLDETEEAVRHMAEDTAPGGPERL